MESRISNNLAYIEHSLQVWSAIIGTTTSTDKSHDDDKHLQTIKFTQHINSTALQPWNIQIQCTILCY